MEYGIWDMEEGKRERDMEEGEEKEDRLGDRFKAGRGWGLGWGSGSGNGRGRLAGLVWLTGSFPFVCVVFLRT